MQGAGAGSMYAAFLAPLAVGPLRRRPRGLPVCVPAPCLRPAVVACAKPPPPRFNNAFASPAADEASGGAGADAAPPAPRAPAAEKKPLWRRVVEDSSYEDLRTFGLSFAIAIAFRTLCVEPRFIPSESMRPTFEIGDQLLVEKLSKHVRPAQAGDVVVFQPPPALQQRGYGKGDAFIKRVVGRAGDMVRVRNGHVERNGAVVDEEFVEDAPRYDWGPATVPKGFVMVLGDNRNNSYDSHIWGFLPTDNIIGRAFVRYWPPKRFGSTILPAPTPAATRPSVAPLLRGAQGL